MTEPVPPAPAGPSQDKPLEPQSATRPQVGSASTALPFIRTRAGRLTAALVLVALAVSYIAGALLFRAAGYRKGYAAGCESVGYFEGAAIADSMKAVASDTVLARAGLMPDSGQHGLWHVARFGLEPAKALCKYGSSRELDTVKVPSFSEHAQAPVGRSYRIGSSSRIYYVDR
jgi:hypothetical protein